MDLAAAINGGAEVVRFGEVPDTAELRRILALPRRPVDSGEALAKQLTAAIRTPWGTMTLRPIQGLALAELCRVGGGFCPLNAGEGKTLISLLAPTFVKAKRPLLIVPASLVKKTRREFRELARHWQCIHPDRYEIVSYETLSRANASARLDSQGRVIRPGLLESLRPDLIVFDEVHKVKNRKAAVTRKVSRFLREHTGVRVLAMSGTATKRSLKDYSHVARWCLQSNSPVPITDQDLEAWSAAIDEKVAAFARVKPGALRLFDSKIDRDDTGDENLTRVRNAFRERLTQTPGVIASQNGALGTSLQLHPWAASDSDVIDQAFERLRTEWCTPDGADFSDPIALWRHARELALGLYYRWNPAPPEEWRAARKAWNSCCREILKTNKRHLDSELQVVRAVALGLYPEATQPLADWRAIKNVYDPEKNKEAVWICSSAIDAAKRWLGEHTGIVWTEHTEFAKALAQATGLAYYGQKGEDAKGRPIEEHPANQSLIASVQSNSTGRNLQKWSKNLIMSAPPNGAQWEQLLARTHRPGQEEDEVQTWLYESCWEAVAGIHQARRDSSYVQSSVGQAQRLCYADWNISELQEIEAKGGYRWNK